MLYDCDKEQITSFYICFQILRVQNRHLFSQFNVKQKELQQKNGTDSELLLWHGTSKDCIDKIINNGFNRSYCGRNGNNMCLS